MTSKQISLKLECLSKESFKDFGDVIGYADNDYYYINNKTTKRYHRLSEAIHNGIDSKAVISLSISNAFNFPINLSLLERHPFGSQAWIPLSKEPFVVVVAPNGVDNKPDLSKIRAFITNEQQGVNYHVGTWHHPLLALVADAKFIIIDRDGTENNCEEFVLTDKFIVDR